MKIVIVIPTYNEAENIGRMIDALAGEFAANPMHDFHILVVEGNSPDGTAAIVKQKEAQYPFVHLLTEEKKAGLGAAYAFGFKYAMKNLAPDALVEMDADFQHDPKDVVRLVEPLSQGYDYVIGSRFTRGGGIPKDWALYRKFLSVGGNLFTKVVLGIFTINDFTSGFKVSRVKGFVDKLNLDAILSGGFAYKMDLLYRMHKLGAKFKEVPIQFGLRDRGSSKMESNNFMDSLRVVVTLRFGKRIGSLINPNFIKFCIVGFIGLFVDTGLFNLLRVTVLSSQYAAITSGATAMITTFLLNNYWSFSERQLEGYTKKVLSLILYVVSSTIPIVVRSKLVEIAAVRFGDTFIVSNAAFAIGIVFGLLWNFTVYSKIIWRKSK